MSTNHCQICEFQSVILTVPSTNKQFLIQLLKTTDLSQKCSCITFSQSKINVKTKKNNLSFVKFNDMNFVLQYRFYKLLTPVNRKKLWSTSKNFIKFRNRPMIFLANSIVKLTKKNNLNLPEISSENYVFKFCPTTKMENLKFHDIELIFPFFEFEYSNLILTFCKFKANEKEIIFHKNLTSLEVSGTSCINFRILPILPNIENLTIDTIIFCNGWEEELLSFKKSGQMSKLKFLSLNPNSITNLPTLKKLVTKQPMKTLTLLREPNYEQGEFGNYFVSTTNDKCAKLIFQNTGQLFENTGQEFKKSFIVCVLLLIGTFVLVVILLFLEQWMEKHPDFLGDLRGKLFSTSTKKTM